MPNTAYHAPGRCPVCGGAMELTRLNCAGCGTEMTGKFALCRFCALEEKHLRFIETFLRCRGSIKEAERTLGVSYPTVRGMLEAALAALGLGVPPPPDRSEVLERLESGEIDVETAINFIKEGQTNGK
ncbi:MAG: DUF2089 domain-containing protein [Oscillospiraceae bacterium]|jgi:hypothetical protein|nr:DUF2089 domain-containing protein [Oscillospiraceae bacterium]